MSDVFKIIAQLEEQRLTLYSEYSGGKKYLPTPMLRDMFTDYSDTLDTLWEKRRMEMSKAREMSAPKRASVTPQAQRKRRERAKKATI